MRKFLKTIGGLAFILGVAGLIYSIYEAMKLKDENVDTDDMSMDEAPQIRKKCIFDELKEHVDIDEAESISLICHFGNMELSFDEPTNVDQMHTIDLDVSFGYIEITVPTSWRVVNKSTCTMGAVDMKEGQFAESHSTLILTGKVRFGAVTVVCIEPGKIGE